MSNINNVQGITEVLYERFVQAEYELDFLIDKAKIAVCSDPSNPNTVVDFGTAVDDLVKICSYNEADYMTNKQLVKELVEKLPGSVV